jgi:hypothetical protein
MRVLVLALRNYAFTDEKSGRPVEGSKLEYLDPDAQAGEGQKGLPTFSLTADTATAGIFAALPLPGVYDLTVRRRPGKGGKAVEMLAGVELVQSVNFADIVNKARKSS